MALIRQKEASWLKIPVDRTEYMVWANVDLIYDSDSDYINIQSVEIGEYYPDFCDGLDSEDSQEWFESLTSEEMEDLEREFIEYINENPKEVI